MQKWRAEGKTKRAKIIQADTYNVDKKSLGGSITSEAQKQIDYCFAIGFNSTPSNEGDGGNITSKAIKYHTCYFIIGFNSTRLGYKTQAVYKCRHTNPHCQMSSYFSLAWRSIRQAVDLDSPLLQASARVAVGYASSSLLTIVSDLRGASNPLA